MNKKLQETQKKLDLSDFSLFSLRQENENLKKGLLTVESSYLNELDDLKKAYSQDIARLESMNEAISKELQKKTKEIDELEKKLIECETFLETRHRENEGNCREVVDLEEKYRDLVEKYSYLYEENQQKTLRINLLQKQSQKNLASSQNYHTNTGDNKENDFFSQEMLYRKQLEVNFFKNM